MSNINCVTNFEQNNLSITNICNKKISEKEIEKEYENIFLFYKGLIIQHITFIKDNISNKEEIETLTNIINTLLQIKCNEYMKVSTKDGNLLICDKNYLKYIFLGKFIEIKIED